MDTSTEHNDKVGKIVKRCAREAALKVAQHWNPGLTYDQQKWALLKLADEIYNVSPAYNTSSIKYNAIPGLEMPTKIKVTKGGHFDPLKVDVTETVSLSPDIKTIKYTSTTSNFERFYSCSTNGCDEALRAAESAYMSVYLISKSPYFVLEDTIQNCAIKRTSSSINENLFYFTLRSENKSSLTSNCRVYSSSTISGTLSKRVNESDSTVNIAVNQNKIRVMTDEDIAYAVPAECNVDIVLGIPTNGAACNANNYDSHTTTVGTSYYQTVTDPQSTAKTTPIYQIAQAFRTFIKNNFYFTRGANVGLIPYSGNLSIPSNRLTSWTQVHNNFVSSYFLSDQNAYPAFFRSCYTYGIGNTNPLSSGIFSNTSIYKGAVGCEYSGLNIMRRLGKFWQDTSGGYNYIYEGDLLSTSNPTNSDSSNYSYKFGYPSLRYVPYRNSLNYLNFCFQYYFDLTTSITNYNTFLTVNPYHIAELQSDLLKVTDLLNCMYPVKYIGNSESNFIFLPVTWANNLFQTWTNDPGYNSTTSTTTLYRQPKSTSDRKKAVIIVVNKPDWFEPNELTYLGYDNDYSEIPTFDSDCIKFDVNYGDTNRKFADGSSYDGTIQGQKKILKFITGTNVSRNTTSGYYECNGTGSGTLSFPKKYLVKVVVEPIMKWTYQGQKLDTNSTWGSWGRIDWDGSKFMINDTLGKVVSSTDGINWSSKTSFLGRIEPYATLTYGNGIWLSTPHDGIISLSINSGNSWTNYSAPTNMDLTMYSNGLFMGLGRTTGKVYTSTDGINWSQIGSFAHIERKPNRALGYANGKWIAITWSGKVVVSYDNGVNWQLLNGGAGSPGDITGDTEEWYGINYARGKYWAMSGIDGRIVSSKDCINWIQEADLSNMSLGTDYFRGLGFNGNIFVTKRDKGGYIATSTYQGTIKFSISNVTNGCTTNENYTVDRKREFFIESSQISGGSDGNYTIKLDMTNIRLISAEITNRPYEKVTPSCSLSGTNIKTNVKKAMTVKVKPLCESKPGSITFYNDNKIEDNVGTHTITGTQTFTFSGHQMTELSTYTDGTLSSLGKNFAHNLSKYKVRYSLSNAKITGATLDKQVIRNYGCNFNRNKDGKILIINDGRLGVQLPGVSWAKYVYCYPEYLTDQTSGSMMLCADACMRYVSGTYEWSNTIGSASAMADIAIENAIFDVYGIQPTFYFWGYGGNSGETLQHNGSSVSVSKNPGHHKHSITNNSNYTDRVRFLLPSGGFNQFYIESTQTKSLYSTSISTISLDQSGYLNSHITLEHLSSNKSTQIVAGDYICFQGDGELIVTVSPTKICTLTHTTPDNRSVTETFTAEQTVTIDPDNYKYVKNSDGTYTIQLTTSNVTLSNLAIVDDSKTCTFTTPRAPNLSRCRWYSGSSYNTYYNSSPYTSNHIVSTSLVDGRYSITGSSQNGIYLYYNNGAAYNEAYFYPGDLFVLTDDSENCIVNQGSDYMKCCEPPYYILGYLGSGLSNCFWPFAKRDPRGMFDWHFYNNFSTTKALPYFGFGTSLPVNASLFYGSSGTTSHSYAFQATTGSSAAWAGVDANHGVQNVTVAALKKLYSDWSSNIRIYVILFRKQIQYTHPITKVATNFSYKYLTDLAANTSMTGTAAASATQPIYRCIDVADEAGLTSTLSSIASELKTWGGYKAAEVVE